jgi:tetratricopeptide (TPR) repeat protein
MEGCGGCPASNGPRGAPAPYVPPPPTPEQIAAQKARALDEQGVAAFNAGDFAEAETLFMQAAEAAPDDGTIALNLAMARDRLKLKRESDARRDAIVQRLDHLSSDLSASKPAPAASSLSVSGATAATELGFMDPSATSKDSTLDADTVDARKVPGGLPKDVDEAITSGYSGEPPGVSDRVRKGFQAVAAHDWKAARAWFQDALNHDPNNIGLKRLTELADFTLVRTQAGEAKTSSVSSALQLPEMSDIRFLFPGDEPQSARPDAALDLPKETDIVYLFPGLADPEAKELAYYTDKYWISRIETDPELTHSEHRPPHKSSTRGVPK